MRLLRPACLAIALVGTLLTASAAAAQQAVTRIVPHQVRGGVYYLEGRGGNIGLSIGEDGVVMIDDQFADLTDRIVAAIGELSGEPIRFVINTHLHGDHTGGNENLGSRGVLILARDEVRMRLQAMESPAAALPVVTFADETSVHLNGEELRVIPVPPAHTDGDSYIHFVQSDVIHMGDVFRTTAYPFIDLANGGTLQGTLDALAIAIGMAGPNTVLIPGHGGPSSRQDVIDFRDMILVVKGRVQELVRQGMTYDQVAARNPTAAYDAQWGDPERFLRAVYSEVGGAP